MRYLIVAIIAGGHCNWMTDTKAALVELLMFLESKDNVTSYMVQEIGVAGYGATDARALNLSETGFPKLSIALKYI